MFRIEFDHQANRLAIHVAGFWRPEEAAALSEALEAACFKARAISSSFSSIIYSGDFPVQAHDVADLLAGVMARCIGLSSGNVAIVVASQLNKLQVERTLVHPRLRPFMTEAEALPWLAA